MKVFKKVFCYLCLISCAIAFAFIKSSSTTKLDSANALDTSIFNYATLSCYGQTISQEHLKEINDTTCVVANNSVTLTIQPFKFDYFNVNFEIDESFYEYKNQIIIEKDINFNIWPNSFDYNGTIYYYTFVNNVLR